MSIRCGEPADVWLRRVNQEWQYSRTWRMHWITDGKCYGKGKAGLTHLWCIEVNVEYGKVHNKEDGYNLYHKGKFVKWGKTVKELKEYVATFQAHKK